MKSTQLKSRYWRIMVFFGKAIIGFIIWEVLLAHIGLGKITRRTRPKRLKRVASDFRKMAIRMGGVMIKVGQFLSSRLDVLPEEIIEELSGLQDEVPPENFSDILHQAETDLGTPLKEKFEFFDMTPLAAASLGQVHRARLCKSDEELDFYDVVVKIQRPHIDQLIEVDLAALRQVGGWLKRYPPIARRADIPALVQEFSTTIREEIDYMAEGQNAEIFSKNFMEIPRVHVPRVVWSHTSKRVLTLEDVFAIKITDYSAITSAGIDRAVVAKELLGIYLKQIFEDGFFHADPHPGNLFITPLEVKLEEKQITWQLTFVDFGMVGRVPDNLRLGLRELVMSVGTRDSARMVRAFQTLDILLPGADLKLIERATSQVLGLFWGKSMSELRDIDHKQMFQFANQFRELMVTLPFQLPQNLLLLGRTMAILSGMCTGLDLEFNFWEQLSPYAARMVSQEAGSNPQAWLDKLLNILKELVALPSQVGRVISQVESGDLIVQNPTLNHQVRSLVKAINGLSGAVIFTALLLGGVFLFSLGNDLFALIMLGISGFVLLGVLVSNHRNSRRS
jgi:predicted unusual protein kinase regulating ubiquinone biosynthesis (AarF/ABC1/UbiB family)